MIKILSVLVIITIGLTGSAHLTTLYLEYPVAVLDTAARLVDTLVPHNSFHVENPIATTKRRGEGLYPFPVEVGSVSGTLKNGVPVTDASVFDLTISEYYEYVLGGTPSENGYRLPLPFNDILDPEEGEYFIYSVNWYPTLYEITGDYGEIASSLGRSTLTAIRVDVVYSEKKSTLETFLFGAYSGEITKTYYLILDNNPRIYEGTFNLISLVDGLYYFQISKYDDNDNIVYTERLRVTYVKNTLTTWKEYVEKELMR